MLRLAPVRVAASRTVTLSHGYHMGGTFVNGTCAVRSVAWSLAVLSRRRHQLADGSELLAGAVDHQHVARLQLEVG